MATASLKHMITLISSKDFPKRSFSELFIGFFSFIINLYRDRLVEAVEDLEKLLFVVLYPEETLLTVLSVLADKAGSTRVLIMVITVTLVIRNLVRVGDKPQVVRYVLLLSEVIYF